MEAMVTKVVRVASIEHQVGSLCASSSASALCLRIRDWRHARCRFQEPRPGSRSYILRPTGACSDWFAIRPDHRSREDIRPCGIENAGRKPVVAPRRKEGKVIGAPRDDGQCLDGHHLPRFCRRRRPCPHHLLDVGTLPFWIVLAGQDRIETKDAHPARPFPLCGVGFLLQPLCQIEQRTILRQPAPCRYRCRPPTEFGLPAKLLRNRQFGPVARCVHDYTTPHLYGWRDEFMTGL